MRRNLSVVLACFVSATAPLPGEAALQLFDDRASWELAAGGSPTDFEDFDTVLADVLYGPTAQTVGFLTLSVVNGAHDDSWRIDSAPASFASIPSVNGTTFATALVAQGFGGTSLSFSPMRALGFDYSGASYSTGPATLVTSSGDSIVLPATSNGVVSFLGVLSDGADAFTSITWTSAASFAAGIDNIAGYAAPVPEPSVWGLLAAGVALLAGQRRMAAAAVKPHKTSR